MTTDTKSESCALPKDGDIVAPDTLVFSGQIITSENAPSTPLFQLSREIACALQRDMAIIFESLQYTERIDSTTNTSKRRMTSQDLYYLAHPRKAQYQEDLPNYYITAASPGTLGNINFEIQQTALQKPEFRAMLNGDKSAAHAVLFNRDTHKHLLDVKLKGEQYHWVDTNGQKIAFESQKGKEFKLHIEAPLQQRTRDAIVALWALRIWHDAAEGSTARC